MRALFPDTVTLDPDEVERINRVRIARYYGVVPAAIDSMSEADYQDTLHVMRADELIQRHKR